MTTTVDMLDHIDAVRALLAPAGLDVHFVDVPQKPAYPYVLLWCPPGNVLALTLDGIRSALDEDLGVTVADLTPEGVLVNVRNVRALLDDTQPAVAGRVCELHLTPRSQPVTVDRTVELEQSGQHPAYAVDLYRLTSTPA